MKTRGPEGTGLTGKESRGGGGGKNTKTKLRFFRYTRQAMDEKELLTFQVFSDL